jgi:hypothetical protein
MSAGMSPVTLRYEPREGVSRRLEITRSVIEGAEIPDFWWLPQHNGNLGIAALVPLLLALMAGLKLTRLAFGANAHSEPPTSEQGALFVPARPISRASRS